MISRFVTDLNTDNEFFTDSNGLQSMRRKFDPLRDPRKPVAANYYPVTSHIFLRDSLRNLQFSVLVDRGQGGSSLQSGELELLLHRRHLNPNIDWGSRLDEKEMDKGLVVRGTQLLILNNIEEATRLARSLSKEMHFSPTISMVATDLTFQEWSEIYKQEGSYHLLIFFLAT